MIGILTASVAPALAILCYLYLRNNYTFLTFKSVLKVFIIGALLVFPIMVIQHAFITENLLTSPFGRSFILFGLTEEFFKWFLLYSFTFNHTQFHKPYDGIVYGVALALGFATVENFLYLVANGVHTAFFSSVAACQ